MPTSFFTEADRRRSVVIILTACLTAAAAVALVVPRAIEILTGVREAPELAPPDDLTSLSDGDTTSFFGERDQIEIRVGAGTTLRKFLDRNRLNKPYQREQIVRQLGSSAPDAPIAAGTVFKLRLTPIALDVPGATTTAKEPR